MVESRRTSGMARTSRSTCAVFSLARSRLMPTGKRTFSWM
jgi:hypothetical protein